jgi:glycosyltransferase involved in cell wall biosynthesis
VKISFLAHNIYGVGGTVRTVLNLAGALAARHEVEIVSVFRRMDRTMFDFPAGVTLVPLVDLRSRRPDRRHPLHRLPTELFPPAEELDRQYTRLTDARIARYLSRTDADVVIGTRPGLNICVARLARERTVRVAQEHMTQDLIPDPVRDEIRAQYPRLSAAVTVTAADAEALRRAVRLPGLRVETIPNSVPEPGLAPADGTGRIVVAAGRLDQIKRYDLLVHAFAKVAAERPDWTLRIYGAGDQRGGLAALVAELGLHNNVFLMGRATPVEPEWVKGSIAAVSSDRESFGMTVVEAMRCGLPVVSTACPVGPPEIIADGVDGLLVPVRDPDALAAGLLRLINDDPLRHRMGLAARANARRFDPATVAADYERLFTELVDARLTPGDRLRRLGARSRRVASGARELVSVSRLRRLAAPGPEPVGDCVSAPGGQITLALTGVRTPLVAVVGRERADRHDEQLVRVPLAGATTGWQVTLPAGPSWLSEGRWNLYAEDPAGNRHRIRAGSLDLRHLVRPAPIPAGDPLSRRIPYRTADGYLAIRAWVRDRHAEAGAIWYGEESIAIHGRLVGTGFAGRRPIMLLTSRVSPALSLTVPGDTEDGTDFRFHVPAGRLAGLRRARHDDWDVWLAPDPDRPPVRVARLLDDVVERKLVYPYPSLAVIEDMPPEVIDESPVGHIRVWPYFTVNSDLSLVVSDRP